MLTGSRILVVDDDDDNRQLVVEIFVMAGAQVTQASSAEGAYELAMQGGLDLLISDIAMPHLDGCELVRRVLADSPEPPLAIALSGHARDVDRARSLAAGFDSHLIKPITPSALVSHVKARLAARPAR